MLLAAGTLFPSFSKFRNSCYLIQNYSSQQKIYYFCLITNIWVFYLKHLSFLPHLFLTKVPCFLTLCTLYEYSYSIFDDSQIFTSSTLIYFKIIISPIVAINLFFLSLISRRFTSLTISLSCGFLSLVKCFVIAFSTETFPPTESVVKSVLAEKGPSLPFISPLL